jgi:uncharacterized cupin superfamily protein
MTDASQRPAFIRHYSEIEEPVGSGDLAALAAAFGRKLGLTRIGINQETVSPGCRTSDPHAHSKDEEFVFVIEGHPDVWIDGELHRLRPGDGVAFPAGRGIAHCFLNNTDTAVRLLIVGERNAADRVAYPLMPERRSDPGYWHDAPRRPLGLHDGRATRCSRGAGS